MSTWGKITSNAAKFWDGFGDGLDNITKPIDDFIDFITQPKELLQDSEGNYFGIDGLSSDAISEYGAASLERERAREQGFMSSPFSNIGSQARDIASATSSLSTVSDIESTLNNIPDNVLHTIPYQGLLDLQNIDTMSIAKELYDIARGVTPNEIAGKIAQRQPVPNIPIGNPYKPFGGFNTDARIEANRKFLAQVPPAFRDHYKKRNKQQKAESEKYLDEAIKRSRNN
jgi:hypothetical protein|tara:strand:+ start:265 stop:951 length:687 start_codon:yes stop_codon:yes gene_type:complete